MKRKNIPTPNALERAIATISPAWALKRHQARTAMALTGGYTGAGYRENMAYWQPGTGDADSDITSDLRELRARSRDLSRNSPIAAGALETDVTNVVGTGLTLQSRIDAELLGLDDDAASEWQKATERMFAMWAESKFSDAFGQSDFYEQQSLAYRTTRESGDAFVILASKKRKDWPFQMALQIIEADRVCNPKFGADTDTLVQGIERADGEPVAVHVCSRHPGATYWAKGTNWQRVEMRGKTGRRNVLHLLHKIRPGQTRGVPALAPIIETLKQLTRYSTAEVDAAVNSAAMAVFVKMDPETFQDVFDDDAQNGIIDNAKRWDGTLRSGAAINLLPGEEIQTTTPGRPNPNFDPFVSAVLRQIGMALSIPHEVLTKHFQSSYSAARAALLDAWRTFRIRRAWLAANFCQPVYEEWLADAVASGLVSAPGFFADPMVRRAWSGSSWAGDGPGALDPMKEAQAAELRMKIGLTTLQEEIVAYDGGDFDTKHAQRKREVEERVEDGLEAPAAPPPGTPGMPGAPAAPGMEPPDPEDETGQDTPAEDENA